MGWWETRAGDVIGDPPLDELDEHPAALHWKTPDDIPPEVLSIMVKAYRDDLGREPRRAELQALLSFHQIGAVPVRKPTPGPAGP